MYRLLDAEKEAVPANIRLTIHTPPHPFTLTARRNHFEDANRQWPVRLNVNTDRRELFCESDRNHSIAVTVRDASSDPGGP